MITGRGNFFGGAMNVVGRDELSFFDVDDATRAPGGEQQVGLAAKWAGI